MHLFRRVCFLVDIPPVEPEIDGKDTDNNYYDRELRRSGLEPGGAGGV